MTNPEASLDASSPIALDGAPAVGSAERAAEVPGAPSALELRGGYRVEVEHGSASDTLSLRAPSGDLVIAVTLTPEGPVLRLSGARVELTAPTLALTCDDLALRAKRSALVEVGGDLVEAIGGARQTHVTGALHVAAKDVALAARQGEMRLEANDDVRVKGERVLLNSDDAPMPLTWEEYAARRAARGEQPLPRVGESADMGEGDRSGAPRVGEGGEGG
jgi:hypothetical protein